MKSLKKTLLLVIFLLSAHAMASDISKIHMDRGELDLNIKKGHAKVTYDVLNKEDCMDKVDINQSGNVLYIKHLGNECAKGKKIKIVIGTKQSLSVILKSGVINLNNVDLAKKVFSQINTTVDSGVISGQMSGFQKFGKDIIKKAHYKNSKQGDTLPTLKASVKAGVLNIIK